MGDPWHDEGFGGENDWDEGEESLEADLEDVLADPDEEAGDADPWGDEPDDEG